MRKLYVLANIDETDMEALKAGADVTITVDAEAGTDIKGKVEEIGRAINSTFSLLPQQNSSGWWWYYNAACDDNYSICIST